MITSIEITMAVLVAIVIGLVEVAKAIGLPTRYAPVLAVVLGVAAMLGVTFFSVTATTILSGIVVGLLACGLYSAHQTTVMGR